MEILIYCTKCKQRTMHESERSEIQDEIVTVWKCTMCRDKQLLQTLKTKENDKSTCSERK